MNQKFDPMTGKPIEETEVQEEVQYDPMTGEPIRKAEAPEEVQYDPMTGEPIRKTAAPEEVQYDPMTGEPLTKKKTPKKLFLIGAAVIAVAVCVIVCMLNGVFLSKNNKVLLAVANTIQDESNLTGAFEAVKLLSGESCTLSVDGELKNNEVEAALAYKGSEMQLSGKLDFQGLPEIEGIVGLDKKELRVKIDSISDAVIVYPYAKKNEGYLIENMDEDKVEMLNELLESVISSKKQDTFVKDLAKALNKEYKKWNFQKVSKEEFEVDGKDRKCTGYRVSITADQMSDLLDAAYDVISDSYENDMIEKYYKNLSNEMDDMPDIDVTFYLYKNMLAAILIEDGAHEYEIQLRGGAARWQNIVVKYDRATVLKLKGDTDGSVEEYSLQVENMELASVEYHKKTGELQIDVGGAIIREVFSVEANIKGSKNKLTIELDKIAIGGSSLDCSGTLILEKGAKMQKISGDEFDLGNADEDEYEEFMRDFGELTL